MTIFRQSNKIILGIIISIAVIFPYYSAYAYCGNGALETPAEECDDGNFIDRDGCSSYCKIEDMAPPTVSSVSIPDGTKDVSTLTNSLTIIFSEQVKASSINKTTVRLEYNGAPLDYTLTLDTDQKTLTVTINQDLYSEAAHSLRINHVYDIAGNYMSDEYINVFTTAKAIDHTAPTVVVDPQGGTYNVPQNVTIIPYIGSYTKSEDFIDKTAKIYYTLNDINLTSTSPLYTLPISIRTNTILRYFAIDEVGNKTRIHSESYSFDCPEFPHAKKVTDQYPDCRVLECEYGFDLRANACVISLNESDPNDYKSNAVTAPMFSSSTPVTIISKPSIYITPEHNGIIPRPIIFKELKRGTIINFEQSTKITDMEGKPFTGYIKPPENLYMKDFPINFGYSFRSIFSFKAADGRDLSFSPSYKITLPFGENYNPDELVTVLTYDSATNQYSEYSRNMYKTDLAKKEVTITASRTNTFFIAQLGVNFNRVIFTDVSSSHWAKNYIEALYRKGIVKGRDANIFAPNENMTRAEFVKVVLKAIEAETENPDDIKTAPFSDVPLYAWYAPYVKKAKDLNLISGYQDGTFGPDEVINRAEAIKIIFTAFNFDLTKRTLSASVDAKQRFADLRKAEWYFPYADFAIQNGIMQGVPSENNNFRYFRPSEPITRAEMAKLTIKTMELAEKLKSDNKSNWGPNIPNSGSN